MDVFGWIFDGFVGDSSFPIRGFCLDGVLVKSCASSHLNTDVLLQDWVFPWQLLELSS